MDFHTLQLLASVRETKSFAETARRLDLDPSAVSRAVANAERSVGIRLFARSTRSLEETEAGCAFLDRVLPLAEEFEVARKQARSLQDTPSGHLRLTASIAFAQLRLLPHLKEFQEIYPDIVLELIATDEMLDLVRDRIDLAFRLAPAPKGDLVSTRIRQTRYHVVASPEWLQNHAEISTPMDLQNIPVLRFALPGYRTVWRFQNADGNKASVDVFGRLILSAVMGLKQAARNGLGPALLADWTISDDLEEGRLVDVFPDWQVTATEFDTSVWALYPSRRYLPAKTRAALDFFRSRLATA